VLWEVESQDAPGINL